MKLRLLLVLTVLFTTVFASNSFARKPAVEDFVGVETENYRATSRGTEVIFNLGNHVDSFEKKQKEKMKATGWFATASLVAFVLLPFFMWGGIIKSVKKGDISVESDIIAEQAMSQENVKHLSDYKTDSTDTDADTDDIKKAS